MDHRRLLALAALLIFGGKLGDILPPQSGPSSSAGVVGFAVTSVAISLIRHRRRGDRDAPGLQGVFGALLMPSTLAIIRSVFWCTS